jgi:hypothetical protein
MTIKTYFETMTMEEKRNFLTMLLMTGEVLIEFTKVDGTQRKMPSTLDPRLLPAPKETIITEIAEPKKERKQSDTTIRVFATDKKEWRSFRIDSVISATPV